MRLVIRLKIVVVFFILVGSFFVSASSRVEDYTHCRGEDGPSSLIVGKEYQIAFESKKGVRLYSNQSLVDKDLAQYNARFLAEKAKGFRSNHAFFSIHIGIRLPLADHRLDQEVTWKEFVLFYNEATKSLEFKEPDIALEADNLRYADFCNHPSQYEGNTTYDNNEGQQFSAEIVEYDDHFLQKHVPRGVMKTNSGHSETRIFSTLLQHPEILKHLFLSLPAGTKIKYLMLKVHSMLDCCCDCQKSFKYASLLLRRLLLSRPDLYKGRILFSKKLEKTWKLPIMMIASNYIHYKKNSYWIRPQDSKDLICVSVYNLPLSHRKPFLGKVVAKRNKIPFILTVLDELDDSKASEKEAASTKHQLVLHPVSDSSTVYEAQLKGKKLRFEIDDNVLTLYDLGIEPLEIIKRLVKKKDHKNIRPVVNRLILDAVETRQLPAHSVFDRIRELFLECSPLSSNQKFWVGVVNRNLKENLTGRELLDYLNVNPPSKENVIRNARSLQSAVESFERCKSKIDEQLLDDRLYEGFITQYISGGGWLSYAQKNLGLLRVIAEIVGVKVYLWEIKNRSHDGSISLSLLDQSTKKKKERTLHLIYKKGECCFEYLNKLRG